MASSSSDPPTNLKNFGGLESEDAMGFLLSKIYQMKKQIQASRVNSIKEKLRRNERSLDFSTTQLYELSKSRKDLHSLDQNESTNMLSSRIENPLCKLSGCTHGPEEKDTIHNQENPQPSTIMLPFVDKIPSYTTWIFLDKNQRMPEDQSVVGRRQIYYDQNCGETLISSDSEEESREPEEPQHAFSEGEDQILWMILQEYGVTHEVLDVLSQFIGASSSEIQGRYSCLIKEKCVETAESSVKNENIDLKGIDLDKNLDAALDSFDNLFCRRCLVFDCRLHGCSQNIVTPCEKQPCISELGENGKPCSDQCYIWKRKVDEALSGSVWRPIEKDLYSKGIEIFGKNSCLITRNLLSGLKTCDEVYTYMCKEGDSMLQNFSSLSKFGLRGKGTADNNNEEQEIPMKSRLFRKRGKARKLKYTWKSSGHPSIRKRIAEGKNRLLKQYTPCGCDSACGKQCPCVENETCCEKYCGCSKICKNRFRGCHCAKSQCRSRQCPCFAANRECDPDVCRNCWVSCGDGSLGEPPTRGDGYQCGNMKLLLKQQQRILLSKSSVAGWGAFIKNPVNKNDYLGEYTGEIISQKEADKRGKIYDRANSSFLFDLNEQYVLDAYRKGDKLKFANHSATPNCFAKVMMVAGDHRVGIFAKEHIDASEELFYDYFYGPDQAPPWARKPEGSKRDDSSLPHGRARKHQSH